MSTQSGITSSPELLEAFKKFVEDKGSILIAEIVKETIELADIIPGGSSLQGDFETLRNQLDDSNPKYIVVKHDDSNGIFTFISYVPDYAAVKDKMLYASSKNSLIRQFGSDMFPHILFLNSLEEVSYDGWKYSVSDGTQKEILSTQEKELQKIKDMELDTMIQSTQKKKLVVASNSLNFKLHSNADVDIEAGRLYSFNIDLNTEEVFLSNTVPLSSANELISLIALDYPQYNIIKLNGKTFFIFSCPSGSKVKERMVYASNKNSVINHFKQTCGIDKSIEVGDATELELSGFSGDVDRAADDVKSNLKFNRPSRPGRRR
jgi:hypothetical protein